MGEYFSAVFCLQSFSYGVASPCHSYWKLLLIWLLLLADKHTYDTPLEVSEAFGSAIKDTLTILEPIGKLQELILLSALGHMIIFVITACFEARGLRLRNMNVSTL